MEFKTLVKARRSCRSFEDTAVTDEQLAGILEAGQWAPSPLNTQPWEFIVITDEAAKAEIREIGEAARQAVLDQGGPAWAAKYGMDFLEQAPMLIVVTVDPVKGGGLGGFFGQEHGALQAASACIQNMMLAASDMGLETLSPEYCPSARPRSRPRRLPGKNRGFITSATGKRWDRSK
jgi:5,6-dimethylbenzimidazole synthase